MKDKALKFDVIIVGSGIAALNTARTLPKNLSIALVTKSHIGDGASVLAQGGISAVSKKNREDSFKSHVEDTLRAGDGLCNETVVKLCVEQGPLVIDELVKIGVPFSVKDKEHSEFMYDLTKEGGHSHRRIYHSGDITGEAIITQLVSEIRSFSNVKIFENNIAVSLIKADHICGVYVLDDEQREVCAFLGKAVVLATGGAGKAYLYTSNPDTATGDGIAMAYRAGASISNMEFYQFHPTCLYHTDAKNFLISEAVRGEGGVLKLKNGEAFMKPYHDMADLAPRDVVARAIDREMKKSGDDCVYLDITHKGKAFLQKRFPNIYKRCFSLGIDMAKDWIPVVPAAHYCCGGITVDTYGRTSLSGLYACGECSCTGLHGANRLASNSLLEAMVYSKRIAEIIPNDIITFKPIKDDNIQWQSGWAIHGDEAILIHHNWDELRRTMWNNVGIVRSMERLRKALTRIDLIKAETEDYYWRHHINKDLIELRNIVTVSEVIVMSAMARHESRGLHFMKDFPQPLPVKPEDTIVTRLRDHN